MLYNIYCVENQSYCGNIFYVSTKSKLKLQKIRNNNWNIIYSAILRTYEILFYFLLYLISILIFFFFFSWHWNYYISSEGYDLIYTIVISAILDAI